MRNRDEGQGTNEPDGGALRATSVSTATKESSYLAHRMILFHQTGEWPAFTLHHRDGVRNRNVLSNFSDITHEANTQTARDYVAQLNRVVTSITACRVKKYIGCFKAPEGATAAKSLPSGGSISASSPRDSLIRRDDAHMFKPKQDDRVTIDWALRRKELVWQARKSLGDPEDAQEVAHDLVANLLESNGLNDFDASKGSLGAWLNTRMAWHLIDLSRRRKKCSLVVVYVDARSETDELPETLEVLDYSDPEAILSVQQQLSDFIESLTEYEARVLEHHVNGCPAAEITCRTCTTAAARKQRTRVLAKARIALGGER